MNFIAIDFETANSSRSSICSLGVAIVENGKLLGTDHFLIKPTPNYYNWMNTEIHGLSNSDTYNKSTFREQWQVLKQYFHNQTIVAHNAAFDCSVLRFTLDEAGLQYPDLNYHCTFRLAQAALPLPSHRLNVVSNHFKIKLNHHNAESDAKASAIIALKLCEKYNVNSLDELSAGLGFKIGKIERETQSYKAFAKKPVKKIATNY